MHKVLLSSIRAKESKIMKLEGEVWADMQSVEIKLHSLYDVQMSWSKQNNLLELNLAPQNQNSQRL